MAPSPALATVVPDGRHVRVGPQTPPAPGPGEARIRVEACGICGSDVHLLGAGLFAPGTTPGHEFAGTVDAVGAGVREVREGDRVAVEPFRTCGACPLCRSGHAPLCEEAQLLGMHAPGGLATWAVAPAHRLVPVPSDLPAPLAALAEPMAVAVHGVARAGTAPGERVLVLGAGPVGLLTVLAARAAGAGEVWITARHPHQAQQAIRLGATRVLAESEAKPDALGRVRPAFDRVVETVGGGADTLLAAAAAVRPRGTVSVVGVFMEPPPLDPMPLLLKEVTLAWSYCYCRAGERSDFERAVALLGDERERLAGLVTHTLPLAEAPRAFARAADRRSGALKVSVLPGSS